VNKHKKIAIVTAILALCASFALWTTHLDLVPLPHISEKITSTFDAVKNTLGHRQETVEPSVAVVQIEVENLGGHFTEKRVEPKLSASVITKAKEQIPTPVIPDEPEEVLEPVLPAAPTELEHWELKRAWSIAVPSLGIRAPVFLPSLKYWSSQAWDLMEEQMQVGLNNGTVAYPHSSGPGAKGALIIAGHSSPPTIEAEKSNYGSVFAKLPDIEIGQDITVTTSASPVTYRVEEKMIVSPSVTSILEQQYDDSVLKLITCYPVGTTKNRMIIIAKEIVE